DDGDRADTGMRGDDVLDLAREDVEPAGDDHVLLAVDDREEAGAVAPRDVARVQPAAAERLGRRLGVVPVALHDEWTAHTDLPRLTLGHLGQILVEEPYVEPRDGSAACREAREVGDVVLLLAQHCDGHAALGLP